MAVSSTSFKKGKEPGPGRPPGAQNKLAKTVKETVLAVFNDLQSDPKVNLLAFGKKHPREFYQIAAKLIPTEIHAKVNKIQLEIVRRNGKTGAGQSTSEPTEDT